MKNQHHLKAFRKMSSNSELDLTGIVWPMCLLEFKRALLGLKSKGIMEVLIRDPDVVDQLLMIVEHSENRLIKRQMEGERVRLCIQKMEVNNGDDHFPISEKR